MRHAFATGLPNGIILATTSWRPASGRCRYLATPLPRSHRRHQRRDLGRADRARSAVAMDFFSRLINWRRANAFCCWHTVACAIQCPIVAYRLQWITSGIGNANGKWLHERPRSVWSRSPITQITDCHSHSALFKLCH